MGTLENSLLEPHNKFWIIKLHVWAISYEIGVLDDLGDRLVEKLLHARGVERRSVKVNHAR